MCDDLKNCYGLKGSRGMMIHEEPMGLGIDWLKICFNTLVRRSIDIFTKCWMLYDIIKPDSNYNDVVPEYILTSRKYYPFFKDYIGAIDGTHVKARLPRDKQTKYIGRKGFPTQNIMAAIDFNMCFIFAWAGWEETSHDTRIFGEALRRLELKFPHPRGGKQAARIPKGRQEKFNYLHSSLRNIVKRTFGVCKARWAILHDMPYYDFYDQVKIVLASMAVHNYIRKKGSSDNAFDIAEQE
ncbi:hypothetical protein RJ639_028351 [Escallonia herrerae]|uniref:DDE Tnp4 domain-containing protein n=1 Tax=Escallonia herrerae TaxID=1293975 RepID=A0AA89BCZ5_9ASTE|nr:hypothetical protein RJ639_028351 [Escallonia herrerae]